LVIVAADDVIDRRENVIDHRHTLRALIDDEWLSRGHGGHVGQCIFASLFRPLVDPPRMKVNPLLDARGVMSVEDWAENRRLHLAEGIPIKMIASTRSLR